MKYQICHLVTDEKGKNVVDFVSYIDAIDRDEAHDKAKAMYPNADAWRVYEYVDASDADAVQRAAVRSAKSELKFRRLNDYAWKTAYLTVHDTEDVISSAKVALYDALLQGADMYTADINAKHAVGKWYRSQITHYGNEISVDWVRGALVDLEPRPTCSELCDVFRRACNRLELDRRSENVLSAVKNGQSTRNTADIVNASHAVTRRLIARVNMAILGEIIRNPFDMAIMHKHGYNLTDIMTAYATWAKRAKK